jgi:hypothetical protein
MADPTQNNKVLHIPTDLYNALKAQCGNLGTMDLSSKASQDWKKLFSTAKFDEIRLRDTQKNIVVPIQALGAFKFNDEVVAAREAIKYASFPIVITTANQVQPGGLPSLSRLLSSKTARKPSDSTLLLCGTVFVPLFQNTWQQLFDS